MINKSKKLTKWTSSKFKTYALQKTLLTEGKRQVQMGKIFAKQYLIINLYPDYIKNPQNSINKQQSEKAIHRLIKSAHYILVRVSEIYVEFLQLNN